ncbi:MAG: hypothetical protein ACJAUG_002392 [Halioglobus sp.]|jgi:hypothetical protein
MKKTTQRSLAFTALIVFTTLVGGCATKATFEVDFDEYRDFSSYKSFRWYDDVHPSKEADYRQYNSSDARVRDHVDTYLLEKGFKLLRSGAGDFWVNYHISKQSHMNISNFSGYPSAGAHGAVSAGSYGSAVAVGYSSGPSVKKYKEGTVVIDIIDAQSSKIVWRGIAEGRLPKKMDRAVRNKTAAVVTRELLDGFPPK